MHHQGGTLHTLQDPWTNHIFLQCLLVIVVAVREVFFDQLSHIYYVHCHAFQYFLHPSFGVCQFGELNLVPLEVLLYVVLSLRYIR